MGQDKAFNTKDIKKIKSINTTINKLLNNVAGSTLGMSLDREHERMELELDISKAVDNEYEQMSRYNSSKDFTSFVNNIMRKSDGVSSSSSILSCSLSNDIPNVDPATLLSNLLIVVFIDLIFLISFVLNALSCPISFSPHAILSFYIDVSMI
jgi:hypothetical protein